MFLVRFFYCNTNILAQLRPLILYYSYSHHTDGLSQKFNGAIFYIPALSLSGWHQDGEGLSKQSHKKVNLSVFKKEKK